MVNFIMFRDQEPSHLYTNPSVASISDLASRDERDVNPHSDFEANGAKHSKKFKILKKNIKKVDNVMFYSLSRINFITEREYNHQYV